MYKWAVFLMFIMMGTSYAQKKDEQIRILELLPLLVDPPMVEPCLPEEFVLGKQAEDPYFNNGYYWGSQNSLDAYFENISALKGCLIRAQISSDVSQLGFNYFSCDGGGHDLAAGGFTEIRINRGKWGIFPYRELCAKGPKGRLYHQMWVGLNTEGGTTLSFEFIYPEYLNEPTQNQKKIWKNFVHKTDLLSLSDLLIAHGIREDKKKRNKDREDREVRIAVEKRLIDQKLFIYVESPWDYHFEVQNVRDYNFLTDFTSFQPFVEIDSVIAEIDEKIEQRKIRVFYRLVDQFSFHSKMLSLNYFEEKENYLLFHIISNK